MSRPARPDPELLAECDVVTVWVAAPPGPRDVWSLRAAISWAMAHPQRHRITLFRPPGQGQRAVWLEPAQIERLALALMSAETRSSEGGRELQPVR